MRISWLEVILLQLQTAGVFMTFGIITTFLGAFSGWFVGLFFEETILGILSSLGVSGFSMWQIGAFLGFVGGFFRMTNSTKK